MTNDAYQAQGFGAGTIGYGERMGIIVVDFQRGFIEPEFTLGGSALVAKAVTNSEVLLTQARRYGLPIIQAHQASCGERDMLNWKIPVVISDFHEGNPETELDPRLYDPSYDVVVRKVAPSVLFQTPAIQYLIKERVDTVIVIGCNTSGCVRATVVDAFSYGFRVIVPEDCCGDVEQGPHDDNLRDVNRRYADVVTMDDVIQAMRARYGDANPA
jgi:maleamate amidohydrolase